MTQQGVHGDQEASERAKMRAESSNSDGISGTATSVVLLAICVISVAIRLFPVVLWGSVRRIQRMQGHCLPLLALIPSLQSTR